MKAYCSSQGVEESAASRMPASGAVALNALGGIALSRLLDALPEAMEASTLEGRVIYANGPFEVVVGRALGEIVGAPALWARDECAATARRAAICAGVDWVGTVTDGQGGRLEVTLLPLRGEGGEVAGCLCLVRGHHGAAPGLMPERRRPGVSGVLRASPALEPPAVGRGGADPRVSGYEHAGALLLTTDGLGNVVHANAEWVARTGFSLAEMVGGHVDRLLSLAPGAGELRTRWATSMLTGAPCRCRRRDGTTFDVLVTTTLAAAPGDEAEDGQSSPGCWVHVVAAPVVVSGAAELVAVADSVQRLALLGRMAGGLAQDFNRVLAAISLQAELALQRLGPADSAREAVLRIHETAQRSARLTRQLLALGRGTDRGAEYIDLDATVAGLDGILRSTVGEVALLRLDLGGPKGMVRIARAELEQVLVNLVANARDAVAPGGEVVVRTRGEVLDAEAASALGLAAGAYAVIEVVDAGVGMSHAVASRAFEPFFTTRGGEERGGLGLSIIQGIVQHAGGAVSFHTAESRGTTFEVRLRLHPGRPSSRPPSPTRRSIRVLVVDDEAPVRRAVTRLVTGAGFDAIAASDAPEALEVLARNRIDLLLTDVVMPGSSGVALAEQAPALYPQLAVVFMSGYAHDVISERGLDPATMLYLQKPFTRLELIRKVERALGISAVEAEA